MYFTPVVWFFYAHKMANKSVYNKIKKTITPTWMQYIEKNNKQIYQKMHLKKTKYVQKNVLHSKNG